MNNKLLLALYDRSGLGAYMPVDYKGHELEVAEHMEKFAELIVRECAQFVDAEIGLGGVDGRSLKEHLGVEE
jgi:hypothetical protein